MAREMNFSKGYRMMYQYLDGLWDWTHDDTLGDLLSGMSLLPDGTPADPAYIGDWNSAVSLAKQQFPAEEFSSDFAYNAAIWFLEEWLAIGWGSTATEVHVKRLWKDRTDPPDDDQAPICGLVRDMIERKKMNLWEKAVKDVSADIDDPYLRFIN